MYKSNFQLEQNRQVRAFTCFANESPCNFDLKFLAIFLQRQFTLLDWGHGVIIIRGAD